MLRGHLGQYLVERRGRDVQGLRGRRRVEDVGPVVQVQHLGKLRHDRIGAPDVLELPYGHAAQLRGGRAGRLGEALYGPAGARRHQRVNRAQELLEIKDLPMDQVARLSGLATTDSLRQHLAKRTGLTPTAYRAAFTRHAD